MRARRHQPEDAGALAEPGPLPALPRELRAAPESWLVEATSTAEPASRSCAQSAVAFDASGAKRLDALLDLLAALAQDEPRGGLWLRQRLKAPRAALDAPRPEESFAHGVHVRALRVSQEDAAPVLQAQSSLLAPGQVQQLQALRSQPRVWPVVRLAKELRPPSPFQVESPGLRHPLVEALHEPHRDQAS